ncbi:MAG TPA: hypothetical protein DF613_04535 [Lachnospiraceae bacterium]|nr:hypothetical protein [Lachnospiraceae bacterium]
MKSKKARRAGRSVASLCMALLMLLTVEVFPVKAENVVIREPQIVTDTSMAAGIKATWDCVWFGSYPQTEVTAADGAIYTKLQNAGGWDVNADVVIDGVKYRRKKKSDAVATNDDNVWRDTYSWPDSNTYHYFRHEPIKWRVLSTNGNYLLLADKSLDAQRGNEGSDRSFAWDTCTLRSWLNGYDAGQNKYGRDYTKHNFVDSAFSAEEKAAVVTASIPHNQKINCENNRVSIQGQYETQEQIFLLTVEDVGEGDLPVTYGFHTGQKEEGHTPDEGRVCSLSDYARAMAGGTRPWRLRKCVWHGSASEGYPELWTVEVDGHITYRRMAEALGVRPALYLDSTALERYSYAGTVCSDGTVNEKNIPMAQPSTGDNTNTGGNAGSNGDNAGGSNSNNEAGTGGNGTGQPGDRKQDPSFAYTKTYNKVYGDKPFALQARLKTGDGSLYYKSSDTKVASISGEGKVTIRGTGICTVTVGTKETEKYNGRSVKATIQVRPKRAALKALNPGKKQLKATWKKDAMADGYQIQCATNKKFGGKTAVTVKKNKTVSRTIKKLKKGKRYYVRVRSYKKVKSDGKTQMLYGAWSKVSLSKKIK